MHSSLFSHRRVSAGRLRAAALVLAALVLLSVLPVASAQSRKPGDPNFRANIDTAGKLELANGNTIAYTRIKADGDKLSVVSKDGETDIGWNEVKRESLPETLKGARRRYVIAWLKKGFKLEKKEKFVASQEIYQTMYGEISYLTADDKVQEWCKGIDKRSKGYVRYRDKWMKITEARTAAGQIKDTTNSAPHGSPETTGPQDDDGDFDDEPSTPNRGKTRPSRQRDTGETPQSLGTLPMWLFIMLYYALAFIVSVICMHVTGKMFRMDRRFVDAIIVMVAYYVVLMIFFSAIVMFFSFGVGAFFVGGIGPRPSAIMIFLVISVFLMILLLLLPLTIMRCYACGFWYAVAMTIVSNIMSWLFMILINLMFITITPDWFWDQIHKMSMPQPKQKQEQKQVPLPKFDLDNLEEEPDTPGDYVRGARTFFKQWRKLDETFDPAITNLIANDAAIVIALDYPDGRTKVVELSGAQYKAELRKELSEKSDFARPDKYSNIKYTARGEHVMITSTIHVKEHGYSTPCTMVIARDQNRKWRIVRIKRRTRP